MTLEIGFLFGLLAAMVALFLTEKWPLDLTALALLLTLILAGYVTPEEAFAGFSSPAVITMLSVLFLSAALQYTGVAGAMGDRIRRVAGDREAPLIAAVMLSAGLLSAFMNNIAAVAVLMPAVMSLVRRTGVPASRLMIPLAYGAILGGTTTLVGTPPNLLTAQILVERGLEPFGLFRFAPFGLALLAAGVLFMVAIGRRLLPAATAGRDPRSPDARCASSTSATPCAWSWPASGASSSTSPSSAWLAKAGRRWLSRPMSPSGPAIASSSPGGRPRSSSSWR